MKDHIWAYQNTNADIAMPYFGSMNEIKIKISIIERKLYTLIVVNMVKSEYHHLKTLQNFLQDYLTIKILCLDISYKK